MAVDFEDLRQKLQLLDVWSIQERKMESTELVDSLDVDSLRALALMAAKRHTVVIPPQGTKTFELLENVIIGLRSEDCQTLARQVISIAPDWMLTTLILASVNRFNTVDQLEIRKRVMDQGELDDEALAAAQEAALQAAAQAASGTPKETEVPAVPEKGKRGKAPKTRAVKEPKKKLTPAERAAANREKNKAANVQKRLNPDTKVKKSWLTGKPKN